MRTICPKLIATKPISQFKVYQALDRKEKKTRFDLPFVPAANALDYLFDSALEALGLGGCKFAKNRITTG